MTTEPTEQAPYELHVTEALEELPFMISELERSLARQIRALDNAKRDLEIAIAASTIKNEGAKNQKLLEAHIAQDPDVQTREAALILAKGKVHESKIDLAEAENAFNSARKLASVGNMTSLILISPSLKRANLQP